MNIKEKIKESERVESNQFYIKEEHMQKQRSIMEPTSKLFLLMPILTGAYNSKMGAYMSNINAIVYSILHNSQISVGIPPVSALPKLQEYDAEVYE